jgi:hypothetical protein
VDEITNLVHLLFTAPNMQKKITHSGDSQPAACSLQLVLIFRKQKVKVKVVFSVRTPSQRHCRAKGAKP